MYSFQQLFKRPKAVVIGMVHLRALPGSPLSKLSMPEICDIACKEASIYKNAGLDGIIIENMHDVPWRSAPAIGPETVSAMSIACSAIRKEIPDLPLGVQVLSGGNREALAIAKNAGFNFIRTEGFVFSHIGDEGFINSCAAEILRYRRNIEAENVLIFTDVKKKHSSHAITADVSLTDTAEAAEMFLSDGVIVTGDATGKATDPEHVIDVQKAVKIPVLVGSGITTMNVTQYLNANALIVGSALKLHGQWYNELDPNRVNELMGMIIKNRDEAEMNEEARRANEEKKVFDLTAEGE